MVGAAVTESVLILPARTPPPHQRSELAIQRAHAHIALRLAWLAHLGEQPHGHAAAADTPDAEATFRQAPAQRTLARQAAHYDQLTQQDRTSPFARLTTTFELLPREADLLALCWAHQLDPGLSPQLARLNGGDGHALITEAMAARVYQHGRLLAVGGGSALHRWRLVHSLPRGPGEAPALQLDGALLPFLSGRRASDAMLAGCTQVRAPMPPLDHWPVADISAQIHRAMRAGAPVRVWISGPPLSGRRTFAACVAEQFEMELLTVDSSAIDEPRWPETYLRAQRQAALYTTALCWHGTQLARRPPPGVAVVALSFMVCDPGDGAPAQPRQQPLETVVDIAVSLPALTIEERRRIWMHYVPASRAWPPGQLRQLAQRHRLTVGEVARVASSGHDDPAALAAASRALTRHRMGDLGRLLDTPFTLADVVLTPRLTRQLQDFLHEAGERTAFWENQALVKLFSAHVGLGALFSGPPGTGKTMAAQALAAELGVDLVRIDLASLVSKYIGETAKNLRRIFSRAARMDAILFFDEADSLFARRTEVNDAHDRHANADTNYLLQQLEEYPGIAILASNQRSQLDPAVMRRLRYVLEFPRPDRGARLTIYRQLVRRLASAERVHHLDPALDALAASVELTGAQIKHALLSAAFAARRDNSAMQVKHIVAGVERELDKAGKSLRKQQRERITRYA